MSSKKDPWYRQCTYETATQDGKKIGTSWLPEKRAKLHGKVYFGPRDQESPKLWTIVFVGGRKRESFLVEHQLDYRHQREMSDV